MSEEIRKEIEKVIEKLECTCIEAYKTRKMRDPNCCACSCDHNDLVEQLAKANERVAELEKENKRESMELRNRLGSALGRNSEYNSAIENMQQQLAKANERVRELENAILDTCSTYHFEPDLSNPVISIKELLRINSKWTLDPEISSDAAKFAIENQIKGAKTLIYAFPLNASDQMKEWVEQLRKEQE